MSMLNGKKIRVLISETELQKRIAELGKEITQDYPKGSDVLVICILKGGILFFADLCRQIDLPLSVDFLRASSYGSATVSSGDVQIKFGIQQSIHGKHVLLVEDIVETGNTLTAVMAHLQAENPASLKLCSLLEKPNKNQGRITIDYLGFSIPDDFVVGYGLDLAEIYRNLPFVGVMEGE